MNKDGQHLGHEDVDLPVLHILPKLFVPPQLLGPINTRFKGLMCEEIELEVTSSLPATVVPPEGIVIRQPLPNRRYFVGGSGLIRYGWIVPLPLDITEFDLTFRWSIEGLSLWQLISVDHWIVEHVIHVTLKPGSGLTYTMDASCWPYNGTAAMYRSPVSTLGIEDVDPKQPMHREFLRRTTLTYTDGPLKGELAGYLEEEKITIQGIPLQQAWSIDAFQEEQLHEVEQTAILTGQNDAHEANGPIEMPAQLFIEAVELAKKIPFDPASDFANSIKGCPGGYETHPALQRLCTWWRSARPTGEPFLPAIAMPLVRLRDDGEYWWGDRESPNSKVEGFNPSGRNACRIGSHTLVLFQATQEAARFDQQGMTTFLPSGEEFVTIGITREMFEAGESDEAFRALEALASFDYWFPAAWEFMNKRSREYKRVRREQVSRVVPVPEDTLPCPRCGDKPVMTEDPTGESKRPFMLSCGDHYAQHGEDAWTVLTIWDHDCTEQPEDPFQEDLMA